MCSLTQGVRGAERDVSDKASGLAEVPCYSLLTSLPASLPAFLGLRSSCMELHADECRFIQQEYEREGIGVTERRMQH